MNMEKRSLNQELLNAFSRLTPPQKAALLRVIKSHLQTRKASSRAGLHQYTVEAGEALSQVSDSESVYGEKPEKEHGPLHSAGHKEIKGINALRYCGLVQLKEDPLTIQNRMRHEWE